MQRRPLIAGGLGALVASGAGHAQPAKIPRTVSLRVDEVIE